MQLMYPQPIVFRNGDKKCPIESYMSLEMRLFTTILACTALILLLPSCNKREQAYSGNKEIDRLEKLARSGDLQATYELGVEYYNGAIGGEHPEWAAKAKSHLEKAAFEGDIAGAYYHLSLCYQNEVGCGFNLEKATEMACKGADLGMIESKFEAARLILQGDYDPFTAHKAFTYAHDAAQEDYPEAWYLYGMICKHGIGTTADSVAGQEWIDKAEAAGYTLED